ncbi:MAG: hypothetical protein Q9227_001827 [Pyrenula ochraceoflavens]
MPTRRADTESSNTALSTISDASLKPFTAPSFDPAAYLNENLPSLSLSAVSNPTASQPSRASRLAIVSSETQSLLSRINAQSSRLSNTLTQLTDEILRSGSRLAYEVEILRGEAIGLSEVLDETLVDDIEKLVVEDVQKEQDLPEATATPNGGDEEGDEGRAVSKPVSEPEYLQRLQMLSQVRTRLEEVVNVFGQAMEWPLPPSEVSIASSFISVSGPDSGADSHSREAKGKETAKQLRTQVQELLDGDGGGMKAVEKAEERVEVLRKLAGVWKGTAEERARIKFVDSLAKTVEERRAVIESRMEAEGRKNMQRPSSRTGREMDQRAKDGGGGGLFRGLQRLRDEIYLD